MIYKCYLIDMYTFIYWKRAKVFFSVPYMTTPLSMTFEETKLCLKNLVKYTFGPYFTFPNLTYMKLLVIFNNLFFNKLFHLQTQTNHCTCIEHPKNVNRVQLHPFALHALHQFLFLFLSPHLILSQNNIQEIRSHEGILLNIMHLICSHICP